MTEALIRAVEMTAKDIPIDLIVHTPGGLVLAAEQNAAALAVHPANVTVYVPHYAMSRGLSSRFPQTKSSWLPQLSWAQLIRNWASTRQPRSSLRWRGRT